MKGEAVPAKRKGGNPGPELSAGNVQLGWSRILNRPVDIFWDLSRDYGPVRGGRIRWSFNPDSLAGKSPYGVTPEQALAALRQAVETWDSVATSAVAFEYGGERRDLPDHRLDLVNVVTFADSEYIHGIQKEAIASARPFALTRRTWVGPEGLDWDQDGRVDFPDFPSGSYEAGTIIDCDIRWDVGGPYADLDFAVQGEAGALSMAGVFLHELGHFLGLVHTPVRDLASLTAGANRTPTMFSIAVPNPSGRPNPMTSLECDDRVSLSMLYPAPEFAAGYGALAGRVVSGIDGRPAAGLWVAAVSAPEGEPYRSLEEGYHRAATATGVFTDQEGHFRIPGLPPGAYALALQTMDDHPAGTNRYAFNTLVSRFGESEFIWDEFYSGPRESAAEDDPLDWEPVTVAAGQSVTGLALVTDYRPHGRLALRRMFGERDYFLAANQLRLSALSESTDLVGRRFPQPFAAPYRIIAAAVDFASITAPPEGSQVVWPELILAAADPAAPSRPDLDHPLAVLRDFRGDGTLLSTDPLPFDYPIAVDRPGPLWLVVRSPAGRFNAFHNIDILGAGQGELQADESFLSFDGGRNWQSVFAYGISWRMALVLEGTRELEPLAEPRLAESFAAADGSLRLSFARVRSLSGAAASLPPTIRLRYVSQTAPYREGSLLREVHPDESGRGVAFELVRGRGADSTVYAARGVALGADGRLSGELLRRSGPGEPAGGTFLLERTSGGGSGGWEGGWESAPGSALSGLKLDLTDQGGRPSGAWAWPAVELPPADTLLTFTSEPGDTVVLVPALPSSPAGFELTARDDSGRASLPALLGLGEDPFEPNERLKDARAIFPARAYPPAPHSLNALRAVIAGEGDREDYDWYRFPVHRGDSVVLDLDAVSQRPFDPASRLDAFLELFDSTGARFAGLDGREVLSDDEHGLDPFATFVSPREATIYLRVLEAAVAYGEPGDRSGAAAFYELRLEVYPRKGDVLRDGLVRIEDLLTAMALARGTGGDDPAALFAADMDDNGRVDRSDLARLFALALDDPLSAGTGLAAAAVEVPGLRVEPGARGELALGWEPGTGAVPAGFLLEFAVSGEVAVSAPLGADGPRLEWWRQGETLLVAGCYPALAREHPGRAEAPFLVLEGGSPGLVSAQAGDPGSDPQTVGFALPDGPSGPPAAFGLERNHPNPFNPSTTIRYSVPSAAGPVRLAVYDLRGRLVRLLAEGPQDPGSHAVGWDGRDSGGHPCPSGVYLYRLTAPGFSQSRKMVLIK